jgi:acetate kinase
LGGLEPLGVRLDLDRNAAREPGARVISAAGSPVAVLVVPTNEELEMATEALAVVGG